MFWARSAALLCGAIGRLHTPEEVKLIVSSIRKHGLLREEQEDIIHTVFDLDRILVREIMVPWTRITCLPLTQDLQAPARPDRERPTLAPADL